MADYSKLQNGSDVRGVAFPNAAGEPVTITPEAAKKIARAFVRWLSRRVGKEAEKLTIGVGRDSRLSGPNLSAAVIDGILKEGASCGNCGMASTPAMFMSTVLPGFCWDGAIMITASHLPWNRNGMKFFTSQGGLEKEDIKGLLAMAGEEDFSEKSPKGELRRVDLMDAYAAHLRQIIIDGIGQGERPLEGFKIAVDAGNGAGGFFPRLVLEPLGADTSASVYLDPDGYFPNHIPNPEDKAAMESICQAVLNGGCDLGIIFDTDVDRAAAVDRDGQAISRNRLIGLMGAIVARETPGSTVVTDSVTSAELAIFLTDRLGLVHRRFKRGYRNVINEGIRLNQEGTPCLLAIETSGHGAMRENYFLDDGAYLAVKIIIQAALLRRKGETLGDLLRELHEPLEAAEYRLAIREEDFRRYGAEALTALSTYAEKQPGWEIAPDNYEGLRVSVPGADGWFLLRMSLHDPVMPLNIESNQAGGVEKILRGLKAFLEKWSGLEIPEIFHSFWKSSRFWQNSNSHLAVFLPIFAIHLQADGVVNMGHIIVRFEYAREGIDHWVRLDGIWNKR